MNGINHAAIASAADEYVIGSPTSALSVSGLRVRLWPVLATIGLALIMLVPTGITAGWVTRALGPARSSAMPWLNEYVNHAVLLGVALLLIVWLSKRRPGEYGLQWPRQKSYVLPALGWGAFFGVLMTAVDYFPQIIAHRPPPDNLALTPGSIVAWMIANALYVGPTEEIPFRGVLQTFLMQRTSGRVRLGRFDMHVAGVIIALLFAAAHLTSFWTNTFWMALGQQFYAFALGILYAYWREKSGSVLGSIVAHNASDGVEYALMFFMTWLWR